MTEVDSLFKNVTAIAAEFIARWHRDAKERLDEMFAKSGTRILLPYTPSLASRNEIFEEMLRKRNNANIQNI